MENALCSDGIPYGGDGGGDTDRTSGSNGGAVSRATKGTENGYLKQLPLKKTLVFFFLDFLRGIAMAVFIRKHIHYKLVKIRKLKSFIYEKDFSFLCFLMKMPLRLVSFGEVLLAQKYPKLGNLFASPVRTGRVGNDNMGDFVWNKSRRGRICPQFFYFSLKYAKKTTFLCLRKAVSTIILCFLPKQNHIRFSGFRHSSSGRTKRPSLRMSTSSNQISPPPYSGVMMSTRSQWIADLLPLGASS